MNVRIVCIGRLKERFWADAAAEFAKRISRFCELETVELADEKTGDNPKPAEIERAKQAECARMEAKLVRGEYVIALDPRGKMLSSEELAAHIDGLKLAGRSRIAFLIGGSYGLTDGLRKRADLVLSFSKMTFSHLIFRVMLLEQIYRAFKISAGEPYHK